MFSDSASLLDASDISPDHAATAEPMLIDLPGKRADLRGELRGPFSGVERIRLRASHTDYRHHELEEGEIVTEI